MRPSSPSPAILFKLLYSRACTPQITNVKYNLPRENTYHFSVNIAPLGMLSETTGVVKTQPMRTLEIRET